MDEIKELKRRLSEERPQEWDALPDISLYMDQLVSYMPRQLILFNGEENLTPAMVNNYIKDGMLPRAEGKRYHRVHLAELTAICTLKQVLSVHDSSRLLDACTGEEPPQRQYAYFRRVLDEALSETADSLEENVPEGELPQLALTLALRSYADKLACLRILDLISEEEPREKKKKKKDKDKATGENEA